MGGGEKGEGPQVKGRAAIIDEGELRVDLSRTCVMRIHPRPEGRRRSVRCQTEADLFCALKGENPVGIMLNAITRLGSAGVRRCLGMIRHTAEA